MTNTPICFYHNADLDGICSGAICRECLRGDVELFGYNYGNEFPWEKVKGRDVYMIDVSLPVHDMHRLKQEARRFVFIDHHISIMRDIEAAGYSFEGLRIVGYSACELAFAYFFFDVRDEKGMGEQYTAISEAVRHLGRYDVWDHNDGESLTFQYGARLVMPKDPATFQWTMLLNDGDQIMEECMTKGEAIREYETQLNKRVAKTQAFEHEWDGLRLICINRGLCNSKVFDTVYDAEKHDAMCSFYYTREGLWNYSLYSTTIDVSKVAKKHGGGGHQGAAGFRKEEFIFL